MKFNVNNKVRVRLTDYGRQLHRKAHAKFWAHLGEKAPEYRPPKEDSEGWSEWQLWSLMQDFGPHMGLGMVVPFETEIEVPNAKLNGGPPGPSKWHEERRKREKWQQVIVAAVELVCAPAWAGVSDEDVRLEKALRDAGLVTHNAELRGRPLADGPA